MIYKDITLLERNGKTILVFLKDGVHLDPSNIVDIAILPIQKESKLPTHLEEEEQDG